MSRRESFVAPRRERWEELSALLAKPLRNPDAARRLGELYRAVAADLAAAQSTGQGDDVLRHLDDLAGRAHNRLYGTRRMEGLAPVQLVTARFPRALRANVAFFAVANLVFYGPFLVAFVAAFVDPTLAERVLPLEQLQQMEAMYASPTGRSGTGEDARMAGFYVFNNIGIALRCFATGALGGLGSLFFLVYNGAVLGTTFGFVFAGASAINLATFASGHGAWELTGIVVSGTAGLRLGWALLVPGDRTLLASLREARVELGELVAGAVALLAVAAAIEGFWSASPIPAQVKWAFALLQVPVIGAWLVFGGRR